MSTRALLRALRLVVPLAVVGAGWNTSRLVKGPTMVMFRGGNLEHPVVLRRSTDVSPREDPLVRLYSALRPTSGVTPDSLHGRRYFEVAEFFIPWSGQPAREYTFEEGTRFSRVYAGIGDHAPIWEHPMVAQRYAGRFAYSVIGAAGQRILTDLGLRLR